MEQPIVAVKTTYPQEQLVFLNKITEFFSKEYHYPEKAFDACACAQSFIDRQLTDVRNERKELYGNCIYGVPSVWPDELFIGKELADPWTYQAFLSMKQNITNLAVHGYVKEGFGFERQSIPPKEAHKFIGHNALDITESKIGAALLYC